MRELRTAPGLFFQYEKGSRKFIRNVRKFPNGNAASHSSRWQTSVISVRTSRPRIFTGDVWHAFVCGFAKSAGFIALIYLKIYFNMTNFKTNKKSAYIILHRVLFYAFKERKPLSVTKLYLR